MADAANSLAGRRPCRPAGGVPHAPGVETAAQHLRPRTDAGGRMGRSGLRRPDDVAPGDAGQIRPAAIDGTPGRRRPPHGTPSDAGRIETRPGPAGLAMSRRAMSADRETPG